MVPPRSIVNHQHQPMNQPEMYGNAIWYLSFRFTQTLSFRNLERFQVMSSKNQR